MRGKYIRDRIYQILVQEETMTTSGIFERLRGVYKDITHQKIAGLLTHDNRFGVEKLVEERARYGSKSIVNLWRLKDDS